MATPWPIRPMPRMPNLRPDTSCPIGISSVVSPHWFCRTMRSPHEAPRAAPRISSRAISAVASVSTSGVLVTAMPRDFAKGIFR